MSTTPQQFPVNGPFTRGNWIDRIANEIINYILSIGTGGASFEVPSGAINGSNVTFTTVKAPVANKLQVFWNGLLQHYNVDYTLSGNTITMTTAPATGDNLVVYY